MRSACSEADCDRQSTARGLCARHYQRYRYHGQLDAAAPAPSTKACAQCGCNFEPATRRWGAIYCSGRCNDAARYARRQAARGRRAEFCEHCGAPLDGKRSHARFCSVDCGQKWRNGRANAAALMAKVASRKPCVGCGQPIGPEVRGNARYCSRRCKVKSRRHETYGLTKAELDLLLAQHDKCAVCQSDQWGKKGPQVDHCHQTGRVRGILCGNCNQGLGRFHDRIDLLREAIRYLS